MVTVIADLFSYSAPSGPPQNIQGSASSSRSVSLAWAPPLLEDQNGIITGYAINVTVMETREYFALFSNTNSLTVGSLRPFSTYLFKIAGETAAGGGTFSAVITVNTPEDGKSTLLLYLNTFLQFHP